MNKHLSEVLNWSQKFNQVIGEDNNIPAAEVRMLRLKLLREEIDELEDAWNKGDIIEAADAMADIQFVLDGTILAAGLHNVADKCFSEVYRSNMSKLDKQGNVIYREGDRKVLKSELFTPPNLTKFIKIKK